MLTTKLPGTELELSRVGFGCWAIGGEYWGEDVDDAQSVRAIRRALDVGVTWFDTAPIYGWGHADEVLRRGLGARRADVVIATKVGARRSQTTGHAVSDLSPDHVRRDCEASLARLGVDCIDLLQVHWPCERGTPLEASLEALVELRSEGKVREIGLCNHDALTLARARDLAPIVSIQTPISMLRREYEGLSRPRSVEWGRRDRSASSRMRRSAVDC